MFTLKKKSYLYTGFALFIALFYFKYCNKSHLNRVEHSIYLWSKKVLVVNDYNLLPTEKISTSDVISDQIKSQEKIIWIRNTSSNATVLTDLNHLNQLLYLIKKPVILVTSDGDRAVPSSYNSDLVKNILASPKIKKWYTQNYDKTLIHPKLGYYPIGLDMHTAIGKKKGILAILNFIHSEETLREEKFNYYLEVRDKYQDLKKNKIFCDSHLSITHPRRTEIFQILKNNALIEFQNKRIDYKDIIEKYAQYRFILSPRGNGLDCHRTWEAFLVGAIVIVESSSLDDMFIKNDLPVIILKSFSELNNITEKQLEKWYNENKHKTEKAKILEKFSPEYWIKK